MVGWVDERMGEWIVGQRTDRAAPWLNLTIQDIQDKFWHATTHHGDNNVDDDDDDDEDDDDKDVDDDDDDDDDGDNKNNNKLISF